ncbi:MAG: dihydrofolate reductase [Verrucomicrobiaceae bacterium]|nr:dihydrofolate reductase [Verrucomicrobiaceae bacterium]
MNTQTPPRLIAIVAMASNRVIGKDGKLPWHLPEDLKFFKETTLGHPILMGRKTYDSIGKPLPKRRNIVLSRTMQATEGLEVIRDIAELQTLIPEGQVVYLIGGAALFRQLLPQCQELILTYVEQPHEGDALMPDFESHFHAPTLLKSSPGLQFRRYEAIGPNMATE